MIEKHSATWEFIAQRIAKEIAGELQHLKADIDIDRTTRTRARIRAFEDVLTWADEAPDTPDEGIHLQL